MGQIKNIKLHIVTDIKTYTKPRKQILATIMSNNPPPPPYNQQPGYGVSVPAPNRYPPQQLAYQGPPPQQYTVQPGAPAVVYGQPTTVVVNAAPTFGQSPVNITCGSCHSNVVTSLEYTLGLLVWAAVGVLFIFGFFLCCWIPCVIDGLKDVTHKCPNCNAVLGQYR